VLEACDADDGVRDGITGDWRRCRWASVRKQLQHQVCASEPDCLSKEQVAVIGRVYAGAKDSRGRSLYSEWALDAGIGAEDWRMWKIGPETGGFPGVNVAMGAPALAAVFTTPPTPLGPTPLDGFRYAMQFDFDRDGAKLYAIVPPYTRSAWEDNSARSPDLAGFRKRGARLLVPHGVSDAVFSVNDTVRWFEEVDHLNQGRAAEFVRVFPVPGMSHCAGGPSTDQFDAFEALVTWVERGVAPDQIPATAGPRSPWPGRTRPLCAYPQVARYVGKGSLDSASSFRCEAPHRH
jgi:feruloyl esterase